MQKCPKCGKQFDEPPALSRYADIEICPMCGMKEALNDFLRKEIENDKKKVRSKNPV